MIPNGGPATASNGDRPRRSREERKKRAATRRSLGAINTIVFNPVFVLLLGLAVVSCAISFFLVLSHPEREAPRANAVVPLDIPHMTPEEILDQMKHPKNLEKDSRNLIGNKKNNPPPPTQENDGDDGSEGDDDGGDEEPAEAAASVSGHKASKTKMANHQPKLTPIYKAVKPHDTTLETPHLIPKVPPLPIFYQVPESEKLIDDLLHHNKPTIAGVIAFFNRYISKLHDQNKKNSEMQHRDKTGQNIDEMYLVNSYFDLTKKEVEPLEDAYRGRTIFPVRDDASFYVSLAAFREHLLGKSLMSAFDQAKNPDKLFFGAVVQNCFGQNGTVCHTGLEVVGKDKNGHDMTSVSPKPPDVNGIEEFCTNEKYKKYCDAGQIRVLYVHDTDALGPQTARFYASKLWGGETYFMQMDAHLEFAPHWDQYYINEAKASKNYPKSVLSAYPPGFQKYDGSYQGGTPGARLCSAEFSTSPVEHNILRIGMGGTTPKNAKAPTQIPFIAAGFFFAHASFLVDVPFDPYAPWCFMGEEIALSLRAWTSGWNIYAPRKNMIAHQYRPGRMGLPKFWESVGRDSGRASLNTRLQKHVLRRVKHMLGYPTDSEEKISAEGDAVSLSQFEYYSMGHERTLEDYLEWTKIDPVHQKTGSMGWCLQSELE